MTVVEANVGSSEVASAAPLSFEEERFWTADQLALGSSAYNVRQAIRLTGRLDDEAMARALRDIVDRHEILRTTFSTTRDGDQVQIIHPPADRPLTLVDLAGVPPGEREAAAHARAMSECDRPFDLALEPAFRVVLLRLGADDHILVIVMHHIITDAWSLEIFDRELSALYEHQRGGAPATLPVLAVQYADYAAWQRASLEGAALDQLTGYWRDALGDAPLRVDLPYDRRRTAGYSQTGATASIALDGRLADELRGLARKHDSSLFMTLLAAFNVLLYRYSGQRDLVVVAPFTNRSRAELEPLLGCFANMLPLRARLDGSMSFEAVLRQVRTSTLRAYEHGALPFGRICAEGKAQRTAGEPLVNVLFHVRPVRESQLMLQGLEARALDLQHAVAEIDLAIDISERSDRLDCVMSYRADAFDRSSIERLLGHFEVLLRSIVTDPTARIAQLPMLSPAERAQQLVEWNDTARPYDGDTALASLFEAQAKRTPDAIAIACDGREITYSRLDALADALAEQLRARVTSAEEAIGICMERSLEAIVGILAVLKAGGAYLPIDPEAPAGRSRQMLADTGATIVLTHRQGRSKLPESVIAIVVDLEADRPAPAGWESKRPCVAGGDALAYVMYTSGSSGIPKGVLVTQRAVCRLVMNASYVTVGTSDVVAGVSNFCFDAFTFEMWASLLHGARLEIAPRNIVLAPAEFARWIGRRKIGVMFLTTALFHVMSREVPSAFGRLRCLLVGGEVLEPGSVAAVLEAAAPARLVNVYGPTEATTFSLSYDVTHVGEEGIPIGRPIANTEAFVLDSDLNLVPIGVRGELYVGGPGLARGYLKDGAATAAKFISHPFSDDPAARLYATGDLVRYLADGNIAYLGRRDRQLKVRGFRVEPGEIEAALRGDPFVRDAFVIVKANADGGAALVAYVIDDAWPRRSTPQWRQALAGQLPPYMLPDAILAVPEFPLNRNGKVDLAALPEEPVRATETAVEFTQPLLYELAMMWEQLLGVSNVGLHDNFFDLGGHSLKMVALLRAVERDLGKVVSVQRFVEDPTIEHLARLLLEDLDDAEAPFELTTLTATGSRTPFFFMHGDLNGGGYYARRFARILGPDQPFYVLGPHRWNNPAGPASIAKMASDYAATIKELRPSGPYALGGYCIGGLLALETARQLGAEGASITNVILIDTPNENANLSGVVSAIETVAGQLGLERVADSVLLAPLGRVAKHGRQLGARALRVTELARQGGVTAIWQRLRRRPQRDAGPDAARNRFWLEVAPSHLPRPSGGRLTVLVAGGDGSAKYSRARSWRAISRHANVHAIPGAHLTCITRFGDETAKHIAAILSADGTGSLTR
jgi:amino acid adenylation domain-containing protein